MAFEGAQNEKRFKWEQEQHSLDSRVTVELRWSVLHPKDEPLGADSIEKRGKKAVVFSSKTFLDRVNLFNG